MYSIDCWNILYRYFGGVGKIRMLVLRAQRWSTRPVGHHSWRRVFSVCLLYVKPFIAPWKAMLIVTIVAVLLVVWMVHNPSSAHLPMLSGS